MNNFRSYGEYVPNHVVESVEKAILATIITMHNHYYTSGLLEDTNNYKSMFQNFVKQILEKKVNKCVMDSGRGSIGVIVEEGNASAYFYAHRDQLDSIFDKVCTIDQSKLEPQKSYRKIIINNNEHAAATYFVDIDLIKSTLRSHNTVLAQLNIDAADYVKLERNASDIITTELVQQYLVQQLIGGLRNMFFSYFAQPQQTTQHDSGLRSVYDVVSDAVGYDAATDFVLK